MKELYGTRCVLLTYHNGKVQLGGALSDHQNIDRRCAKGAKGSGCNTRRAFYSIADESDDRDVGNHGNAIDSPPLDFSFELPAQSFHGLFSVVTSNDQRDVLLG